MSNGSAVAYVQNLAARLLYFSREFLRFFQENARNRRGQIPSLNPYKNSELVAYRAFRRENPEIGFKLKQKHRTWLKRVRLLSEWLEQQNVPIREDYLRPYNSSPKERMAAGLPVKYQIRAYNVLRDLARVHVSCPELLATPVVQQEILDLSSGACGLYECLSPIGHNVECQDFFPEGHIRRFGNAYSHLHKLLGIEVQHFDGRKRPFELGYESKDYIFCFQAIDAYAPADKWSEPVIELLKVARKSVVVVLNPPPNKEGFHESVENFLSNMRSEALYVKEFQCPDTKLPGYRFDKDGT